jgi:hypothetical protein
MGINLAGCCFLFQYAAFFAELSELVLHPTKAHKGKTVPVKAKLSLHYNMKMYKGCEGVPLHILVRLVARWCGKISVPTVLPLRKEHPM